MIINSADPCVLKSNYYLYRTAVVLRGDGPIAVHNKFGWLLSGIIYCDPYIGLPHKILTSDN